MERKLESVNSNVIKLSSTVSLTGSRISSMENKIEDRIVTLATDVSTELELMKKDIRKLEGSKEGGENIGGSVSTAKLEEMDPNLRQMMKKESLKLRQELENKGAKS